MKKKLSDNHILIHSLKTKVKSPIFNKEATGYLSIYSDESDFDNFQEKQLATNLNSSFDHNPDGALFWIPALYKKSFIKFAVQYWQESFIKEQFNFDNGGFPETLLFHDFEEGYLVEMLDPEAGAQIFPQLVRQFLKQEKLTLKKQKTLNDFCFSEDCHLLTSWEREILTTPLYTFLKSKGF